MPRVTKLTLGVSRSKPRHSSIRVKVLSRSYKKFYSRRVILGYTSKREHSVKTSPFSIKTMLKLFLLFLKTTTTLRRQPTKCSERIGFPCSTSRSESILLVSGTLV